MNLRLLVLALALVACSGGRSAADLPVTDAPPPPEQIGDAPAPGEPPNAEAPTGDPLAVDGAPDAAPVTPESLYGACRDRVEGIQIAGECTTDADCARAGCSQEVCVPARQVGDVMTTCEILPCFNALDACGCHEGMCSWTLKSEVPGPIRKLPLPKPQ